MANRSLRTLGVRHMALTTYRSPSSSQTLPPSLRGSEYCSLGTLPFHFVDFREAAAFHQPPENQVASENLDDSLTNGYVRTTFTCS